MAGGKLIVSNDCYSDGYTATLRQPNGNRVLMSGEPTFDKMVESGRKLAKRWGFTIDTVEDKTY